MKKIMMIMRAMMKSPTGLKNDERRLANFAPYSSYCRDVDILLTERL